MACHRDSQGEGTFLLSERKEKRVIYTPELCTGCGICSQMCPKEAISMGLVGAVARGVIDDLAIHINQEEVYDLCFMLASMPIRRFSYDCRWQKGSLDTYVKYGTKETTVDMGEL